MAETQIYQQSRSHYQDPPPSPGRPPTPGHPPVPPVLPVPGSGNDTHSFSIPSGLTFARYDLHIDTQVLSSSASVTQSPANGATGNNSVIVHWVYTPSGKISYTLTAYATDATTIAVGDNNWIQKSQDVINQHQGLRLDLRGPDARTLADAFRHVQGQPPLPLGVPNETHNIAVVDDVTAAMVVEVCVILAVVAIVALVVILLICIYAINKNYKVNISFISKGPLPWDQELVIGLDPR